MILYQKGTSNDLLGQNLLLSSSAVFIEKCKTACVFNTYLFPFKDINHHSGCNLVLCKSCIYYVGFISFIDSENPNLDSKLKPVLRTGIDLVQF